MPLLVSKWELNAPSAVGSERAELMTWATSSVDLSGRAAARAKRVAKMIVFMLLVCEDQN